jgi:hypothetical protein
MKYLKLYESFIENDIDDICKICGIEDYTINEDGSIDVDGNVDLENKGLAKLPLKFRKVTGDFNCIDNKLISLEGAPKYVGGNFNCSYNQLTSLEDCPESVGGYFSCKNNKLTSLEHFPKVVVGDIYLYNNPVSDIWLLFYNKDYIELFNDYDIIHDDEIIIDRLNDFLQEIGKPPVESVEGYNNI